NMLAQSKISEPHVCRIERTRLDNVRPGVEVGAVELLDHARLREHEHIGAVLQGLRMAAEAGAAIIVFARLTRVDQRAHRAVEKQDAIRQQFLQQLARIRHAGSSTKDTKAHELRLSEKGSDPLSLGRGFAEIPRGLTPFRTAFKNKEGEKPNPGRV